MSKTERQTNMTTMKAATWPRGFVLVIPICLLGTGCIAVRQELPPGCTLNQKQCVERIDRMVKHMCREWQGGGTALLGADETGWTDVKVTDRSFRYEGSYSVSTTHGAPREHSYQDIDEVQVVWSPGGGVILCGLITPLNCRTRVVLRGGDRFDYIGDWWRSNWTIFPFWLLKPTYAARNAREDAAAFEYMRRSAATR